MQRFNLDALANAYREDGFVELRGYLGGQALADVKARTLAVVARLEQEEPAEQDAEYAAVRKNLHLHDPWALEYLQRGPHLAIVRRLIGETPVPVSYAWFEKRSGKRDVVRPHVDAVGRADAAGATMWIALDPVSRQSGCLHYLRGSHRRKYPPKVGIDISGFEADDRPMAAEPGDAFIHSAGTVHWSDRNETAAPRRAVALFYWGESSAPAMRKAAAAKRR